MLLVGVYALLVFVGVSLVSAGCWSCVGVFCVWRLLSWLCVVGFFLVVCELLCVVLFIANVLYVCG